MAHLAAEVSDWAVVVAGVTVLLAVGVNKQRDKSRSTKTTPQPALLPVCPTLPEYPFAVLAGEW